MVVFPLVAVGLLLALVWLMAGSGALYQLSQALAQNLPPLPVVTWQQIFGAVGKWFSTLGSWINSWITPLWHSLWAHYDSHLQGTNAMARLAGSSFGAAARIKTVYIPHAVAGEQDARQQADTALWNSTVGLAEQTQASAQTMVSSEALARQTADGQLWDSTVGLAEQVQAQDASLVQAEATRRTLADQGLWDSTVGLAEQVQAQLSQSISGEATLRAAKDAELQQGIDLQGQGLTNLINSGLAATAATAAAQLLQEVTRAKGVEGELDQAVRDIQNSKCQQFCGILGELGQLLSGLELAGLIALVAAAYENPQGAVETINQDLVGPVEQGFSSALGLFGVKVA